MRRLRENLLFRFSAVSFVVMALVAVVLAIALADKIRSDAVDALVAEAVGHASGRVLTAITPSDLEVPMTGARYQRFHEFVQRSLVSDRTARVKLWAADGTVIYSDDPAGVGLKFPENEGLLKALRRQNATNVNRPQDPEHVLERHLGALLEVYTPVIFPGTAEPKGALEIYQHYAPTAQRIDDLCRWLFLSIGLGFVILYAGSVSIVWGGWRTIKRQQGALKELTMLEERERIAREMHDGLAQQLGYLYIKIGQLEMGAPSEPASLIAEELRGVKRVAAAAYGEVRQAIFGLKMMVSRDLGLIPTLTEYLHEFSQETGISVELKVADEATTKLSAHAEVQLIRIIQEALANIRKHAHAKRAWVIFETEGDKAKITVQDDGRGFDSRDAARLSRASFGLQSMRERAELAGGTSAVESQQGKGTSLIVRLPIDGQEVASWNR